MITPEGDYLSNLQAPDLRGFFKHLDWRVMPHSMGHLVASDWADKADDDPVFGLYKKCGLWTRDEAAILYNVAASLPTAEPWLDIGSHTGWTTAHIIAGNTCAANVDVVEPMLLVEEFQERFKENVPASGEAYWVTSQQFFQDYTFDTAEQAWGGFCIDGDHQPGKPLEDAQNAYKHLADTGVIVFHDGLGRPVREAVTWLMDQGMNARCYWSPHLVFVCWRGDFTPPEHEPDKRIDWRPHLEEMKRDFNFLRLS